MNIPEGMSGFGATGKPQAAESAINMGSPQMLETQEASPEEQAIYEAYVNAARLMIYDKGARQAVMDMLDTPEDPKAGLIEVVGSVATRAAKEIGKARRQPVSSEILLEGLDEIITAAVEMADKAGLPPYDQQALDGAMIGAADRVRVGLGEDVNKEEAANAIEAAKGMSEQEIAGRFGGAA
jgi:hypothetical protein